MEKATQNEGHIKIDRICRFFLKFQDIESCICYIFSNVTCTCKDFTK